MIIFDSEYYQSKSNEIIDFLGDEYQRLKDQVTLHIGDIVSISVHNNQQNETSLSIDFNDGKIKHRVNSKNQKELLIRALSIKPNIKYDVFDATAGLGRDSFIMASSGVNVTMFERNPLIFLLLENGIMRAKNNHDIANIANNMSLNNMDFIDYNDSIKPYAVYLDPMFPERKKSALVKKDMQIFHIILKNNIATDESLLLNQALKIAHKKVVVKRPIKAPNLAGRIPNHVVSGKTCRYDVYVP